MRRAGIVLCGGRSLRMGRPKAFLPWFGRTLVEHVVASLAPCVDEILVVTARDLPLEDRLGRLAARHVVDREAGRGPLAALRDGLAAARAERAFVTSVDAPFVTAAAVAALFERAEIEAETAAGTGAGRIVVPRAGGHLQVLSAVYARAVWRDAEALLETRSRASAVGDSMREASPLQLLERVGFVAVEAEPGTPVPSWTSFNTPDEYLALARRCDPSARASVEWIEPGARSAPTSPRPVPIGRLGDVVRTVAPPDFPLGSTPGDSRETADLGIPLVITLGDGAHAHHLERLCAADLALPVGPGERVRVSPRGNGP